MSNAANHAQTVKRIRHVIPESDGNDQVELLIRLPIQHITEDKLAVVGNTIIGHQYAGEIEHLRSKIKAGDVSSTLGQWADKAPGTATDVTYCRVSNIAGFAHDPIKALIHVASQPVIKATLEGALLAAVDGVELGRDLVPVLRDLTGFILGH